MTSRPLRFGLILAGQGPVSRLAEEARRAEEVGFDVVSLPDHLGMTYDEGLSLVRVGWSLGAKRSVACERD